MTAPALDLESLEVLVGPGAWVAHNALSSELQVKTEASWRMHQNLYLVAADVLEAVCQEAQRKDAGGERAVKRMKDGGEELEFFASQSASAADASSWCEKAARYRRQAAEHAGAGAGGFLPMIEPWGVEW